jgi:hypothetical protein
MQLAMRWPHRQRVWSLSVGAEVVEVSQRRLVLLTSQRASAEEVVVLEH